MNRTFGNKPIFTAIMIAVISLAFCIRAAAFIQREYALQEVLDESTNIVSGKVRSVDKKRMRAVVEIQKNLKGNSKFKQIKMNIAVGQTKGKLTSPKMMMSKLENGLPIIVFYQKQGRRLAALGYVSGTWFQLFADNRSNKDKIWWNHSHIEAYMHRTFSGTTEQLLETVKDMLTGKMWAGANPNAMKVLVLSGNVTATAEFLALKNFGRVGWRSLAYHQTKDLNLPGLEKADILWIGQRVIGSEGYHLNKNTENRIKRFVEKGGVVILSSQDSDPDRPCGDGWTPEPILGVDGDTRSDFHVVNALVVGNLFRKPNRVKSGQIVMDDTWTKWSKKYTVLATTNSGKDVALAMLPHGRGLYLITALQNSNEREVKKNAPLMENLIHFVVNRSSRQADESTVKVLALTGNNGIFEFSALEKFYKVGKQKIGYIQTKDRRLPGLNEADILWIGQSEISEEKYLIDKNTERKIISFVKNGGVVIVAGQDSDDGRPCGTGWIGRKIVGVERNLRGDFQPTKKAGELFRKPNEVKSGQLRMDDTWTDWDKKFDVLATTNSGKDLVVATLREGKGLYIVTGLQNESQEDVKANTPLMENLIYFAVNQMR